MLLAFPAIDPSVLEAFSRCDEARLHRFHALFRTVCRWQHARLAEEVAHGHLAEAGTLAHCLQVACECMGERGLGVAFHRIEADARQGDLVALRQHLGAASGRLGVLLASEEAFVAAIDPSSRASGRR